MFTLTAGIIHVPLDDEIAGHLIASGRHHLDVSSLGIARANDGPIPLSHTDAEDLHVVA